MIHKFTTRSEADAAKAAIDGAGGKGEVRFFDSDTGPTKYGVNAELRMDGYGLATIAVSGIPSADEAAAIVAGLRSELACRRKAAKSLKADMAQIQL